MHRRRLATLALLGLALPALTSIAARAQAPKASGGRIEALLSDGWEVAGYIAAWENRSLILLRHKSHPYLVQCSVLIDVTRTPRQVITCYDLR